ncbi:hypothetical protein [Microbacterium panaciterrae]|uniref:Helix-turn-helix domain-containing protein n=1 Tax=Microbacterium panaciterrae TaxID=985759 RepID=A0ABP8PVT9_9MICO
MADQPRSAQELVRVLRGQGISIAEIAGVLNRSPRMVRKVEAGQTSGALYREALDELATTGQATKIPPRRRLKDGTLMPVRGKVADGQDKMIVPEDTGGRYTAAKQGGRVQVQTGFMTDGGRLIQARIPKGRTAKGRQTANVELLNMVRSAARGQRGKNQKLVTARVTFANGRQMEVNTYNASTMLKRIKESDGDVLGWFASEAGNRYINLDTTSVPITGLQLNVFQAPKTEGYDREQAAGRTRRTRRLSEAEKARQQARAQLDAAKSRRGRRGSTS